MLSSQDKRLWRWFDAVFSDTELPKMADKFEALEQQLELFIENTRQLAIIVGDFQPQGQTVLNQKL